MKNTRALAFGIGTLLCIFSCSPPLHRARLSDDTIPPELFSELREPVPLRGSGSVVYTVEGERQSGWFDVHYTRDRSFTATFYSPFGTIIGSIIVENDSGRITLQGQEHSLSIEQALDTLSFPWSRELRLEDLTSALCGKIMPSIRFPNRPPDNIQTGFSRISYIWRGSEKEIFVLFSRCLRRLKRILVKYTPENGRNYSILYNNFFGGFARIITFKVDDRNYFSIRYDRLRKEI